MYWSLMTTHADLVLADYSQTKKRASQGPGVHTTNDFTIYDYSKISAPTSTSNA